MSTALITGGAKRIGAHIARRLAAEGFRLAIHYNASSKDAQALRDELNQNGEICEIFQADLADKADLTRAFIAAREWLGGVRLCINNASLFVNDDLTGITEAAFDAHLAVNVKAPVYLAELVYAQCGGLEDCLIVNMLDNKVFALNPDFFSYTISKQALHSATRLLARKFDGFPRVCGVAPSITLVSGDQTQEEFERTSRINPLHRRVAPEDLAQTIIYMWHEKALDDQIITVDGGQTLMRLPRDVAFLQSKGEGNE